MEEYRIDPVPCQKCGYVFKFPYNDQIVAVMDKIGLDLDCDLTDEEEALIDLVLSGYDHECV